MMATSSIVQASSTDGHNEDWEEDEPLMLTGRDCHVLMMMKIERRAVMEECQVSLAGAPALLTADGDNGDWAEKSKDCW